MQVKHAQLATCTCIEMEYSKIIYKCILEPSLVVRSMPSVPVLLQKNDKYTIENHLDDIMNTMRVVWETNFLYMDIYSNFEKGT